MAKVVIQSMSLRARRARAKAKKKDFLSKYGFPNGQPPSDEAALGELFRFWKVEDHYLYVPQMHARLRHLIKTGVLEVTPPLEPGQRIPGDVDRRQYRVLKRHRLLRNVEPAPPAEPAPTATAKTTIRDRAIAAATAMKQAGEIPEGIKRQPFARDLAARIGDPENYRYIGKDLEAWGLWPIAAIPLLLPPPKDGG